MRDRRVLRHKHCASAHIILLSSLFPTPLVNLPAYSPSLPLHPYINSRGLRIRESQESRDQGVSGASGSGSLRSLRIWDPLQLTQSQLYASPMDNLPVIREDTSIQELAEQYDRHRLEAPRKSSTHRSVNAVHDAFDLVGGVPRLALWADANPTDFYTKIWNRTIQTNQAVEHSGELIIRTAIPRSPLDGEWEEAETEPTP